MIRIYLLMVLMFANISVLLRADTPAEGLTKKPDSWFQSVEGRDVMEHLLSWQSSYGDWPKNKDTTKSKYTGDREELKGTFDNGATLGELRALARAYRITLDERYRRAFLLGFDHVIAAQYSNGGWPQYYPLSKKYHRHITFNDGTMIRILEFLRDATSEEDFKLLDTARRSAASKGIDRAVDCIVKCQVVVDGTPTVWCAQHDAETLVPVEARSYELASLSGSESTGILMFLMSLKDPSPEVIRAVEKGVAWFESAKIEGYRYRKSRTEAALSKDPSAPSLWARFYELKTNRPIFSDRDGVVKYDIEEIGSERRGGYTWYGTWGSKVLDAYKKWPYHQ